jgi:hypothetical protein
VLKRVIRLLNAPIVSALFAGRKVINLANMIHTHLYFSGHHAGKCEGVRKDVFDGAAEGYTLDNAWEKLISLNADNDDEFREVKSSDPFALSILTSSRFFWLTPKRPSKLGSRLNFKTLRKDFVSSRARST